MTDQSFASAMSGVLVATIPILVAALVYTLRQWSDARRQLSQSTFDSSDVRNKISFDAAATQNAKDRTVMDTVARTQIEMLQLLSNAINQLSEANRRAADERGESNKIQYEMSGHMSGMMAILNNGNERLRTMTLTLDDVSREMADTRKEVQGIKMISDTLETDIGESVAQQFGPVVTALQSIGLQLDTLSISIHEKNQEIVIYFQLVRDGIESLEKAVLDAITPAVIAEVIGDSHETRSS